MCKRYGLFTLMLIFCVVMVSGGQTKKIVIGDFKDFQEGVLRGTSVDNRGRLFIGPRIHSIPGPDSEYYLSVAATPKGGLLLGTGHGATVFRIPSGEGKPEKIFSEDQLDVYGLVATPAGSIFVGTSPNGSVYRISSKGKVEKVFTPREKFIWALEVDLRGRVYCAVGNHGAVYRLEDKEKGDPVKIFDAEDAHITSLYASRDGAIYAGSADRGILYRISDNKVRVMFDSPFEEIRGISEDDRGRIYFAATRLVRRIKKKDKTTPGEKIPLEKSREEEINREMSALFRLNSDGSVEKIWESMKETIYDLCYLKSRDVVYLGTGDSGRIYQVTPDGDYSLLMEAQSAQIFKVIPFAKGVLAITNNTAGIWRVEDATAGKGEYLSRVYDLMVPSRFGRISWRTESGSGGVASVFVRTGNSRLPDKTWTPWSPPFTDPANARMDSRGYRYIQFKVGLNSANLTRSPQFTRLTAYYLQNNLRPRIRWLKTQPRVSEKKEKKPGNRNDLAALQVLWKAEDPNSDQLQAAVELRRVGGEAWVPFKEHIAGNLLEIDPRMVADGEYQLRLKVNDGLSNPPEDALEVSQLSRIFTVDSTAPNLEEPQVQSGVFSFRIVDATSPIMAVTFSTDGKLWLPLSPVDGLLDSRSESFRLGLQRVRGNRLVYIRYSDEYGNYKIYQHQI